MCIARFVRVKGDAESCKKALSSGRLLLLALPRTRRASRACPSACAATDARRDRLSRELEHANQRAELQFLVGAER